jgi:nicotinamidase-related amidase
VHEPGTVPRDVSQALLVVDMQNDFFEHSELARCKADLVRTCNTLIERARATGVPVFEVRTLHTADRSTWSLNMLEDDAGVVIEGTHGAEPVEGLDTTGAIQVHKTRDSAFHRTELELMLDERRITSFALCGVSTESCIALTACDAYAHDIVATFVEEGVASIDPELNRQVLANLTTQYRLPLLPVRDVTFATADVLSAD